MKEVCLLRDICTCLLKPSKIIKWKYYCFNIPHCFHRLSLHRLSSPILPGMSFPLHDRGVLIIQPISLCVCHDSCRWMSSHRERDVKRFCPLLFREALQWEQTMGSCWTLRWRTDYREKSVSTSHFMSTLHAYFSRFSPSIFRLRLKTHS